MSDVSSFMAFGKRFSLDIKLHGIGTTLDHVSYETDFDQLPRDFAEKLVEHIVPRVITLLNNSKSAKIRELGERLALRVGVFEYPDVEIVNELGILVLTLNRIAIQESL